MARTFAHSSDYSDDMLSAFDIGGILFQKYTLPSKNGLESDYMKLTDDLHILEVDFKNVVTQILDENDRNSQCRK